MNIEILQQAVMDSRDGITISDNRSADNPLVFVNPAFERMTGYSFEEITSVNCRYLQGNDRDQPGVKIIHDALAKGEYCMGTLRNYRKDGTMFWNELSISPIFDKNGHVSNFVGIQKDVTIRVLLEQELTNRNESLEKMTENLEKLAVMDGLTGIHNRRFFDAQLDIQWKIANRHGEPLTLIMIDVDLFKQYNDIYGHQAGDAALKIVAHILNAFFLRGSDFVARYGGEEFVALMSGYGVAASEDILQRLRQRVEAMQIQHARSSGEVVTISAGLASTATARYPDSDKFLNAADAALYVAKRSGRNRVQWAGDEEVVVAGLGS